MSMHHLRRLMWAVYLFRQTPDGKATQEASCSKPVKLLTSLSAAQQAHRRLQVWWADVVEAERN